MTIDTTLGTIGPLPTPPETYEPDYMIQLIERLDLIHQLLSRAIGEGWQVSNVTADTVLNADSTTLAEVADVLGTLITLMIDRGLLGR